jgi:hypothetical protein
MTEAEPKQRSIAFDLIGNPLVEAQAGCKQLLKKMFHR